MISKFFNGGKVLHAVALTAMLSTQLFAGVGSVSSNADRYPGLGTLFPAFGGSAEFKSARLYTDKASYLASDTVRINGEGFDGYERVRFAVGSESKDGTSALVVAQWDVYADGKGRVETTWDVPSADTFTVTATGDVSGFSGKIEINPEAEAVSISQCANGSLGPYPTFTQNPTCPENGNTGWVTGNVGSSKAGYFEGDSITYRAVFSGLAAGQYQWKVGYDTTKGGLNALDYMTGYRETINMANPCDRNGTANFYCADGDAPDSSAPITPDPVVAAGRNMIPITQIAGSVAAWGAVVNSVSVPVYEGNYPDGDSSAVVTITFTVNAPAPSYVVLAWGGHISTRADWGDTFGSVNITGSPYHMFNRGLTLPGGGTCCGGSQDLQLAQAAVRPAAKVTVVKEATPPSAYAFSFSFSGFPLFTLFDDQTGLGQHANNTKVFEGITTFGIPFSLAETNSGPYTLGVVACGNLTGTTTFTPISQGISFPLEPDDDITCTFNNDFTTATEATVSGRVLDPNGNPLKDAWVSATDSNGTTVTARTNQFGRYTMNVEGGLSLFMDVAHKRFTFGSQLINVNEDSVTVDFTGVAR